MEYWSVGVLGNGNLNPDLKFSEKPIAPLLQYSHHSNGFLYRLTVTLMR